ncbi:MAG: ribbon-helix-helix protein, CopG family [Firmicutes bacterium]|nr:ribbon-helix-helix protein, CopG family [Bacillota bacterium]
MPRPRSQRIIRRLNVELPPDLAARLDETAKRLGITRTQLLCDALEHYLAHQLTVERTQP